MPTKKPRVQILLDPKTMDKVQKLMARDRLRLSTACAMLVNLGLRYLDENGGEINPDNWNSDQALPNRTEPRSTVTDAQIRSVADALSGLIDEEFNDRQTPPRDRVEVLLSALKLLETYPQNIELK